MVTSYFRSSGTAQFSKVGMGKGEESRRNRKIVWPTVPIDWHHGSPSHFQVGRVWSKLIDLPLAAFNPAV
jgi:hypothetical protein